MTIWLWGIHRRLWSGFAAAPLLTILATAGFAASAPPAAVPAPGQKPAPASPAGSAPAAPATTSAAPATTSAAPATTSAAPATTSAAPATTSAAPATTSAAPATTSAAPATTSAAPATTSAAPATTSAAPATTSAAPATTSAAPATTSAAPATAPAASTAAPPKPKNLEPLQSAASSGILGKKVTGPDGKELGLIVDVVVAADGHPLAAIIDFGGFLGVGSRKIAIDWRLLRFDPGHPDWQAALRLSGSEVQGAPEYKPDAAANEMVGPPWEAPASSNGGK